MVEILAVICFIDEWMSIAIDEFLPFAPFTFSGKKAKKKLIKDINKNRTKK